MATDARDVATATATTADVDADYPGTAVDRLAASHARVASVPADVWNGPWPEVRRKLLWAAGLKYLPDARPGGGYTGHAFNDDNHCAAAVMRTEHASELNHGRVAGIAYGNPLGGGIRVASLPELGRGGSWSTCMMGCGREPPADVAHVQFSARVAFYLVWAPTDDWRTFVLVDDAGRLLAKGRPQPPALPHIRYRMRNYAYVEGSRYAVAADAVAAADSGLPAAAGA